MDEKQPESEAKNETATGHPTEAEEITNMEVATEAENVDSSMAEITETSPSSTDKNVIESEVTETHVHVQLSHSNVSETCAEPVEESDTIVHDTEIEEGINENAIQEISDIKMSESLQNETLYFSAQDETVENASVESETGSKMEQNAKENEENEGVSDVAVRGQDEQSSVEIKTKTLDNERKEVKPNDEGEILSDHESHDVNESCETKVKDTAEVRKRPRVNEENDENLPKMEKTEESPSNKKAALEHLRSMRFSRKDPFGESSSRDHRPYDSQKFGGRDISPIRSKPLGDSTSQRGTPHRTEAENGRRRRTSTRQQADSVSSAAEEQRRQRSTMFLLQNEQQRAQHHRELPAVVQKNAQMGQPLKQRIETLLAVPDDNVMKMPANELRALLIYAAELCREQDRMLNGRHAQLVQLDQMIDKERILIERISQDLPPQYRPNLADELMIPHDMQSSPPPSNAVKPKNSNFSATNFPPPRVPTDFSVPPPIFNELTTPLANPVAAAFISRPPPTLPPNFNVPPPSMPASTGPFQQSAHTGSTIINKQPVTSVPTGDSGTQGQSLAQTVPPAIPPMMFSGPPPLVSQNVSSISQANSAVSSKVFPSQQPQGVSSSIHIADTSVPPPSLAQGLSSTSQAPPSTSVNFSVPPPSSISSTKLPQHEKPPIIASSSNATPIGRPNPSQQPNEFRSNITKIPSLLSGSFSRLPPAGSTGPPVPTSIDMSVPPPTLKTSHSSAARPTTTSKSSSMPPANMSQPPPKIAPIEHVCKPPLSIPQKPTGPNQQTQQQSQSSVRSGEIITSVPPPNLALQLATAPLSLLQSSQPNSQNPSNRGTAATPPRPAAPPRPLMSIDLGMEPPQSHSGFSNRLGPAGGPGVSGSSPGRSMRSASAGLHNKQQMHGKKQGSNSGGRMLHQNRQNIRGNKSHIRGSSFPRSHNQGRPSAASSSENVPTITQSSDENTTAATSTFDNPESAMSPAGTINSSLLSTSIPLEANQSEIEGSQMTRPGIKNEAEEGGLESVSPGNDE
ncbi:hypothetical protein Ddc_01285 [Ditylenchus destructor]|nr:hypothetical protein Ddc_01285 [Ditylenchus destructor]